MKKFSKIQEDNSNSKFYEVSADIKLVIESDSEGEAGYLSDSILGGIKEEFEFTVNNIKEISREEYKRIFELNSNENLIINEYKSEFENRYPNLQEKMEFYHKMRNKGFNSSLILKHIENK